jgi:hypothetical protein
MEAIETSFLPSYSHVTDVGGALVPSRHEVIEVVEDDVTGIILKSVRPGIADKEGEVLR